MNLKEIFRKVGVAPVFSFVALAIFLPLFLTKGPSYPLIYTDSTITFPLGSMIFFMVLTFLKNKKDINLFQKLLGIFMTWIPLPVLFFIYENLKQIIHIVNPNDYTPYLIWFDRRLFGTDLCFVFEKIVSPLLTDVMAFFYAIYFAIPFVCLFIFYIKKMDREFRLSATMLVLCFYIGFIGYMLFPMHPPWFHYSGLFTKKLEGIILHHTFDSIYKKHNPSAEWGAFPSLHVGASTLGLLISYTFKGMIGKGRAMFFVLLPFVIGLWISTIYLRHHWFVDVVGGWGVALLAYWMGLILEKAWEKLLMGGASSS